MRSVLPPLETSFDIADIGGIPVHVCSLEDALAVADRAIQTRRRLTLGMVNIAKLINARKDHMLRESLLDADLVLADGQPVVWLSRLEGTPLPGRVAGIDLMERLLELAANRHYSVFLLGAEEEVNRVVADRILDQYPGCTIAGRCHGYFPRTQESAVAGMVRRAGPDILFVALSPPNKELFLKKWSSSMRVPVCHGVGGSFNVLAGRTVRAPIWMQRSGLEWLHRVSQEPWRLWKRYAVTNAQAIGLFAASFARYLARHRPGGSKNR